MFNKYFQKNLCAKLNFFYLINLIMRVTLFINCLVLFLEMLTRKANLLRSYKEQFGFLVIAYN